MTPEAKSQPSLADLMLRFVNRPVEPASIEAEAGALGEVEPHEVAVGFRADPRLAWQEGLAVLDVFGMRESVKSITAPSEWAAVVVRQEAVATQPFALASYPQRVRDLTALLQAQDLTKLRPSGENRSATPALKNWAARQAAKGTFAGSLLAAAVLRAAHDFEQAERLLNDLRGKMTEKEQAAFANEEAALLWQRGKVEKAAEIWERLPESPAVMFNRGMAALFLNQTAKARQCLKTAIAGLPENDGWHHLGSLYLALAEMRI
jgi:tetratricopeptide (TPR) repeat protein